eukprot:2548255-Pleurochrysis_carterae.AAC.5
MSCCPSVLSYRKFAFSKPVSRAQARRETVHADVLSSKGRGEGALLLDSMSVPGGVRHRCSFAGCSFMVAQLQTMATCARTHTSTRIRIKTKRPACFCA